MCACTRRARALRSADPGDRPRPQMVHGMDRRADRRAKEPRSAPAGRPFVGWSMDRTMRRRRGRTRPRIRRWSRQRSSRRPDGGPSFTWNADSAPNDAGTLLGSRSSASLNAGGSNVRAKWPPAAPARLPAPDSAYGTATVGRNETESIQVVTSERPRSISRTALASVAGAMNGNVTGDHVGLTVAVRAR